MTPAEQTLLLAVLRWARAEGITWGGATRWAAWRPKRWGVHFDAGSSYLEIWRGPDKATDYQVRSIAEAVDVLAALGIVPARFSSAYRAGWDACVGIMRIPGAVIRPVTQPGDDGRGTSSGTTRVGPDDGGEAADV